MIHLPPLLRSTSHLFEIHEIPFQDVPFLTPALIILPTQAKPLPDDG